MMIGVYIDPAVNYEDCARSWAEHFGQPFHATGRAFELDLALLQATFTNVYPETVEHIEVDPQAFAERVADYRYGLEA